MSILKLSIPLFVSIFLLLSACGSKGSDAGIVKHGFDVTANQSYFNINTEVKFVDKSASASSQIVSWNWNFGDGTSSTEQNPNHIYKKAQVYTITLTVKDDQNNTKTSSRTIRVSDPNKGLRRILYQTSDTVYVCAHRAVHLTIGQGDFPENSMTSIKAAIDNKIDIFECDVRVTSDGVLVLMHDATVNRTTNGSGTLSQMSYADVRKLRLKNYTSGTVTTDTVPTLKDVLRVAKNRIFVVIDIDDAKSPVASVLRMVEEMDMVDDVMFFSGSSSDASYLIGNGAIALPSCYSTTTFNSYIQSGLQPLAFQVDSKGYNEEWLSIKSKGIKLYNNVYLLTATRPTSNNWASLNSDIQQGVNIVQTDYPIEMLNYLKSIRKH